MDIVCKPLYMLFISLSIISFSSFGQKETPKLPIDKSTNKITYSEVVPVDSSVSKQELFGRAREWFAKTYRSSTNVIQMEDKESGIIVGKALFQVYHRALGSNYPSGYINYTISVYLKDGRYKYVFTNFYHSGQGMAAGYGVCEDMLNTKDNVLGLSYQKTYNYYLSQLDLQIQDIASDLKESMKIQSFNNQDDTW